MSIVEALKSAMSSLMANKMRTFLTMLGMVIGVGAVIALMSVGAGVEASITAQIRSIGTNLITVSPGSTSVGGVRTAVGTASTLTYDDAKAIADPQNVPAAAAVSAELRGGGQAVFGSQNTRTSIVGVTPDYEIVHSYGVADGQFISDGDVGAGTSVAVLGSQVASTLFGGDEPVGQTIKINRIAFRVIGVMESKGGTGFGSMDDSVFIPLSTAQRKLFGANRVSSIVVQAVDEKSIQTLIGQVTDLLRQRHNITIQGDDFTIVNQADVLASFSQVGAILTAFLGAIAGISLVVGGIGIMNIMLVAVTERTREIGIRKAVGARRRDIMTQFLIEALVVSCMGGAIGLLLGFGGSQAISRFGLQAIVQPNQILLAIGVSASVGIFFGIYPARRASRLNPIDALRHE